MSSKPCVGCAWRPSQALTTCTCDWRVSRICLAIMKGAPDCEWRTTNMSACIAARLSMVSSSDSPLLALEAEIFRLMTSADRRFEAISKVVRVRVEFSKNRLNTLLPRISGTFFTSRSPMLTKDDAVSRILVMIALGRPSMVSRCCSSPFLFSCGLSMDHRQGKSAVVGALQLQGLVVGEHNRLGQEVSGDRQLAAAAVNQRRQQDARRAAVVEQFVDRGARGAACVEHIVDQHDGRAFDIKTNLARLDVRAQALLSEVVAIERNVDEAKPVLQLQLGSQTFCKPGAAGMNADDGGVLDALQTGFDLLRQLGIQRFCVQRR